MKNIIKNLKNNEGVTLRAQSPISYKTGWQVATHGVECKTAEEAYTEALKMGERCGVWFADGVYYVDHSIRVKTKREALAIGRAHNQISVFGWARQNLAYC